MAARLPTRARASAVLLLCYSMLAEVDPTHCGIARVEWAGADSMLRVLAPRFGATREPSVEPGSRAGSGPAPEPSANAQPSSATAVSAVETEQANPANAVTTAPAAAPAAAGLEVVPRLHFLGEGMRHILTGYGHVLFLICLLLPSVMRRTPQGWLGQLLIVAVVSTMLLALRRGVRYPLWVIRRGSVVAMAMGVL